MMEWTVGAAGSKVTGLSVETYIGPPLAAAAGWVPSAEEVIVLRGRAACVFAEPGIMKNRTAAPGIGEIARFLISVSPVKRLTRGVLCLTPLGQRPTAKR